MRSMKYGNLRMSRTVGGGAPSAATHACVASKNAPSDRGRHNAARSTPRDVTTRWRHSRISASMRGTGAVVNAALIPLTSASKRRRSASRAWASRRWRRWTRSARISPACAAIRPTTIVASHHENAVGIRREL